MNDIDDGIENLDHDQKTINTLILHIFCSVIYIIHYNPVIVITNN